MEAEEVEDFEDELFGVIVVNQTLQAEICSILESSEDGLLETSEEKVNLIFIL